MAFDFNSLSKRVEDTSSAGEGTGLTSTTGGFDFKALSTEPPVGQVQTKPASDTFADVAMFPATGKETVGQAAFNVVGNIPSSGTRFAKGVVQMFNPAEIKRTFEDYFKQFSEATQQDGISADRLAFETVKGLPEASYELLVPNFIKQIVKGDGQKASATLQNDPVGQIAPLILIGRGAAYKAGVGPQFDAAVTKVTNPVVKPLEATGKAAGNTVKYVTGQSTGLEPSTITEIVKNPSEFSRQAQTQITRPSIARTVGEAISERAKSLRETGAGYDVIRKDPTKIPVDPTYLTRLIEETTGLKVRQEITPQGVKGTLETSGSATIRNPSDVSALQRKIYDVWQPEFSKGYLTPEQFLNLRTDLKNMAYNESGIGKSTVLSNLSAIMRGKANEVIRPKVTNLKAIDESFAPEVKQLSELKKGLVDKEGNLTDAAINKIANATGKGKDPLLARLEQLVPGITQQIRLLKAIEDLQNAKGSKTGTYIRAGGVAAGIATFNPYVILSAILSMPEIAVPLLRGLGYSTEFINSFLKLVGIKKGADTEMSKKMEEYNKEAQIGLSIKDVSKNRPNVKRTASGKIVPTDEVKAIYKQSESMSDFKRRLKESDKAPKYTKAEAESIYEKLMIGGA